MDFPKKQAQRLMPLYLLEYSEKLFTNHPDPSAPWGGGGGSDYTAGQGITITNNEISVDTNVIATKSDISSMVTTTQLTDALDDYALKTEIPTDVSQLYNDAGYATETWVQNQGYATSSSLSSALNGYIKNDDDTYTAVFKGKYAMVKPSEATYVTIYGGSDINRVSPYGLPGYRYEFPDKNGTFAMTADIPSLSDYPEIVDVTNVFPA